MVICTSTQSYLSDVVGERGDHAATVGRLQVARSGGSEK